MKVRQTKNMWNTRRDVEFTGGNSLRMVLKEDGLVERAHKLGPYLHRKLTDLGEQHPSVGAVRSIGLFGAIELVKDRNTKEPMAPYNSSSPEMDNLRSFLLRNGVYIYTHWHTILIIPPLIITKEQLDDGFSLIDQALSEVDKTIT